jgi:hypothetical protein
MASTICAVHCLLTGVALGLLSVMGLGFLGSPVAEFSFLTVAVVVGVAAVWHGSKRHHSVIPALMFVTGLACWLTSHFAFGHGTIGGTVFSVAGGLCLVSFHVLNQRMAHVCGCGCKHNH